MQRIKGVILDEDESGQPLVAVAGSLTAEHTDSDHRRINAAPSAVRHYPHLQAARGLAALLVILHHASVLFLTSGVLAIFAYGSPAFAHAAVVFFFVLSGFVLSRSLQHRPLVTEFYIRRICRIYPCLWLAIALTLLIPHPHSVNDAVAWADVIWAENFYRDKPAMMVVAGLLGVHLQTDIVPPAWSISVELVGSLLLVPLLLFRTRLWVAALLSIAWIVALPEHIHFGIYVVCFFGGVLLSSVPLVAGPAAAITAMLSMLVLRWTHAWAYHAILPTLFEAGCAAVVISWLVSNPPRWLGHRLLLRLGDISYSVYLLHFPIMAGLALVIGRLFAANTATLVLLAVLLPTVIVAAELSFRFVEMPGINLGRFLARFLDDQRGTEAGGHPGAATEDQSGPLGLPFDQSRTSEAQSEVSDAILSRMIAAARRYAAAQSN